MGAGFVRVSRLPTSALSQPLGKAFEAADETVSSVSEPALGVIRCTLFSGLSGAEVIACMDTLDELELPGGPCAFAALVPRNANKVCKDVLDEIQKDHEATAAAVEAGEFAELAAQDGADTLVGQQYEDQRQ